MANHSFAVLPSAARTATPTITPLYYNNSGGSNLVLVIDTTAVVSTPSTVVTVVGYDATSTKAWTILASAAITGTGTIVLRVGLAVTPAANLAVNDMLPTQWGVTAVHGNANSHTYSIGAHVIDT